MTATMEHPSHAEYVAMPNGKAPMSKVDRYEWVVLDKPGRMMWIDKGKIGIDPLYQREDINNTRVLEIASSWSWVACGVLVIARRADGSLWAVDGQHRKLAADKRHDIKELPCIVFDVDHVKEEAIGYIRNNTLKSPIKTLDRFKALTVTEDPVAAAVKELLDASGYTMAKHGDMTCNCPAAMMRCFRANKEVFTRVWPVIVQLHGGKKIRDRLVQALWYLELFLVKSQSGQSLLDGHNLQKLLEIGVDNLEQEMAKASAYFARGGAKVWAEGVANALNYKRSARRLPSIPFTNGAE